MSRRVDLTGQRFGKLVVVEYFGKYERDSHSRWKCLCDCGNTTIVAINHLRCGRIKSCGCYSKQWQKERLATHGMRNTTEFGIWCHMRQRCFKDNHPARHRYGGRGVTVCDRWLGPEGFANFIVDMGRRPSSDYSLDRVDNDGNYEPSNCRWATRKVQNNNTARNVRFRFQGKNLTLGEWAEEVGMNENTLCSRIRLYGWSIEDALTKPIRKMVDWRSLRKKKLDESIKVDRSCLAS